MKNIYNPSVKNIDKSVDILKKGGNIVIPTETVYGLAGIANNNKAVAQIYNIKNRPEFNPLIAHCCDIEMVEKIAVINDMARKVLNYFNRGSITIVLPSKDNTNLSKLGCAGLDTVAIRIPNNKICNEIICKCGFPLFAPSANYSGGISPTKAEHVYKSLGNKVDMILDGGASSVGIESTIIDLSNDEPAILRAGAITQDELENFIGIALVERTFAKGNNPIAPGQLKSHYKPKKKLFINIEKPNSKQAFLGYGDCEDCFINLSKNGDLVEVASNLFDALYKADESEFNEIAIAPIPNYGIGIAINDKIKRASI